MAIVGEAALSFLLEALFREVFSSILKLNVAWKHKHKHVISNIKELEKNFGDLKAVLQDAEDKQLKDRSIGDWLEDVERLTYDAQNLFEEFFLESRNQCEFSPKSLLAKRKIEKKLSAIVSKSAEMMNRKAKLDLLVVNVSCPRPSVWKLPSGPISTEPVMVGRREEMERLIKMVIDEEEVAFDVIPIVGMGGLGKTTVAQFLYNDDVVKQSFEVRGWVWVSKEFDLLRITKGILEAVTCTAWSLHELGTIQNELSESLNGKKFLIVLDDYWNPSYEDWQSLAAPLICGAKGSKIIFTTRNFEVAGKVSKVKKYHVLTQLSDDESWELFCRHSGLDSCENLNSRFEMTGREIARKCMGLPLAIMALGGLLRGKDRIQDWIDVLKSRSWTLTNDESKTKSVLKMSYDDLPARMKRCFAMCALFPKDYKFYEKEVVLLWLGAGLVSWEGTRLDGENTGLEIGHVYFQELVGRSMFLPFNSSRYYIHDLVREIAGEISGNRCCIWDEAERTQLDKTFHLSYHHLNLDGAVKRIEELLKTPESPLYLRTFYRLYPMLLVATNPRIRNLDIAPLLKLRHLRVLSLSNLPISKIPASISKLRFLRSFNASHTYIEKLPSSITSLFYLEILDLSSCTRLIALPLDIGKLENLKYLDASCTDITEVPCSFYYLRSIEILILNSCTRLNKISSEVKNLTKLRHLDLMRTNISTLPESIASLIKLECLILEECSSFYRIPSTIGDLINLRHVDLSHCGIRNLPATLCSLRNLEILNMSCCDIAELPAEFSRLTNLKSLVFSNTISRALPSSLTRLHYLQVLDLSGYQLLDELPEQIGDLRKLKLLDLSSTSLKRLPNSATLLSNLEDIKLTFCTRFEELPEDIGDLSRLKNLIVSHTNIALLPGSVTTLKYLETLDLSYCKHVDELPEDIGNLKNLRTLKLLHGGISMLPDSLTSLCSLEILEMSHCEKLMELPGELGRLKRLKILNLSWCENLKVLPDSTTALCCLEILNICSCPKVGEISAEISAKMRNSVRITRY